jgi:cell division protein ZapA (FtsZ GTPase activity inhibitor)
MAIPSRSEPELGHSYRVNICGESLQLRSDQPPHVIEKVAGYLDQKIREISQNTMNGDKFRMVAMAALNLSEELLTLRSKLEDSDSLNSRILKHAQNLSESLDKATTEE